MTSPLNWHPVTPILVVPVGISNGDVRFTLPPQGIDRTLKGVVIRFQSTLLVTDFIDLTPSPFGFTKFPLNYYLGSVGVQALVMSDAGDGGGFPGVRRTVPIPIPRNTSLVIQTTNIVASAANKFVMGLWF